MLEVLGPFTSDGRTYVEAIDALAGSESEPPELLDGIMESIRLAAAARDAAMTATEPTVLALATGGMSTAQLGSVAAFARQQGLRVSAILSLGRLEIHTTTAAHRRHRLSSRRIMFTDENDT